MVAMRFFLIRDNFKLHRAVLLELQSVQYDQGSMDRLVGESLVQNWTDFFYFCFGSGWVRSEVLEFRL